MKKNETEKCQEAKIDCVKHPSKYLKKEVDIPRLTSDFLEETLQIAWKLKKPVTSGLSYYYKIKNKYYPFRLYPNNFFNV